MERYLMSGFMRKAALVVGAVALVAATAGAAGAALAPGLAGTAGVAGVSTATLTAIGTYGGIASGVLSAISVATAPRPSQQGSQTSFTTNPQSGLPYAIGRTRMSGLRIYAQTNTRPGYDKFNDLLWFGVMLSVGGQIEGIERFTADNEAVSFDASGNAIGTYRDYQAQRVHLGGPQSSALALSLGGGTPPGWTGQHKLSGVTHALWCLRYNKQGEMYGAGAPEPSWIGKWVKVYDPRLDSTYPGGSGPCRALNESTYVWSQNPGLHALTWALGRWQNGKRTCGIGAPVANIRVGDFVECANVCDANGWKVGGVEWTTDSKWDALKRMLQAGGARPTQTGAMIGCLVSTPRTAVATIESRHLLDSLSISATKSRRDRFNTVIPRYVDEDSDWSVISGTAITVPDYVTADRGQRTKEIDYPLVQVFSGEQAKQPGQLAAYDIVNSREAGPIDFTTGPEWIGLKTGDVVLLNVPEEGLVNQPVLITRRAPDPSTGKVSFSAQTETLSKHAFALGQTTTPPSPFQLTAPDLKPPAPIETSWAASGTTTGEGLPAIVVTGESDMPSADSVLIDYRLPEDDVWTRSAILSAVDPVQHVIVPLESETGYQVRIGYRVEQVDGDFIILSATTGVGKLSGIEDGATVGATPEQVSLIDQINQEAAAAAAAAAAAQAAITAAQGRIDDIEASIGNLDLDDLNEQIGAIESDLSGAQTSITNLQAQAGQIIASVGQVGTRVDQVESSVSTLGGSVSTLSQTVTNLNGTVATLSSTVSTQGGQISQVAQSVTTLSGTLSSLNTIVTASSSPNLIQNGGFENMLRGWSPAGQWGVYTWAWGRYAECTGYVNNSGQDQYFYLTSDAVPCAPGPNPHAQSFDYELSGDDGVQCYGEIVWLRDDNSYITQTGTTVFGRKGFDQSGNSRIRHVHTSPSADTAKLQARVVFKIPAGATATGMRFRQLKVELGNIATPYSGEATAAQSYQAFSDLNSSFASLSTTVSSQGGSITTLQQSFTSLNGTVASLSSTVTAQGGTISNIQQVQATQSGTIASLTNEVRAGNPNLIGNGSGENGLAGWEAGYGTWSWTNGSNFWGNYIYVNSAGTAGQKYYHLRHTRVPFSPGVQSTFTCGADVGFSAPGGVTYVEVRYEDNAGNVLAFYEGAKIAGQLSFGQDVTNRLNLKCTTPNAPSGTTHVRATVVFYTPDGVNLNYGAFRQAKLEQGTIATAYSMEATVNQAYSAISSTNGAVASLSSTVATQGSSISQNATAISGLQGQQASLSSTVATQGAAIGILQTATSTLQGNVATLTTQVTAGSPNLLRNGGFEMGNMNYWTFSQGSFNANSATGTWGPFAQNVQNVPDNSWTVLDSNSTDIERDWHTLTADVGYFIDGGSGSAYLEIIWFNGSGGVLGQQGGASRLASFNFTSDGATRRLLQVTAFPPEGTARAAARIVWHKANGVAQSMHVRQVKLERGQVATPYSADASVVQSFQALSTLDTQYASLSSTVGVLGASVSTNATAISNLQGQYASLSSTVSTLNSTVTVQQAAINNLNGKTAAWWQVEAVSSDGRAQLRVWADAVGGGGVDIIGDLRVTGNALIGGTVNPEALALDRFVKRIYGTGTGSPNAGETRLLYAQDVGYTTANGSYLVEMTGSFQTTVGRLTTTSNGKPYYQNHLPDGGLLVRLNKNGNTIAEVYIRGEELVSTSNIGFKTVSLNRNLVFDAPGGGDSSGGNATILIYAIRGNQDTGQVDDGDTYYRNISATYSNFSVAAKTKWTFI